MLGYILSLGAGFASGWISRGFYDDACSAEVLGLPGGGAAYRKFEDAALGARAEAERAVGKDAAKKLPIYALPGCDKFFPPQTGLPAIRVATPAGPAYTCADADVLRFLASQRLLTAEQLTSAGISPTAPAPVIARAPVAQAPVAQAPVAQAPVATAPAPTPATAQ